MSKKETLFSEYSQQFADRITGEFFARNNRVTSKTIMEVQSIKQVNLFVIKNLYDQWQRETANLRSPFFDYDNPDVQTALQSYMNTLSHHISLDQTAYQELLRKSVAESLNLVFYPFTTQGKVQNSGRLWMILPVPQKQTIGLPGLAN